MSVDKIAEELFLDFANSALEIMRLNAAKNGGIPGRNNSVLRITDNKWSEEIQVLPDFSRLITPDDLKHMAGMETTQKCIHNLIEVGILDKPQSFNNAGDPVDNVDFSNVCFFLQQDVLQCVIKAAEQSKTLIPEQELLINFFGLFCDIRQLKSTNLTVIAPLFNFSSDITTVSIGPLIQLTAFTTEEKTLIWKTNILSTFNSFELINAGHKLVGNYSSGSGSSQSPTKPELENEIETVMTTLRLLKRGGIGWGLLHEYTDDMFSCIGGGTKTRSDFVTNAYGPRYELLENNLEDAKQIYASLKQVMQVPHCGGLEVALRRFNQMYSRDKDEDRIIDLTIALESCLLTGMDELRYRLALRGAALLSKQKDPKVTQSLLRDIYDARSKIVHEGQLLHEIKEVKSVPNHELPEKCEEITRLILKEYLARISKTGKSVNKINEDIEDYILNKLL